MTPTMLSIFPSLAEDYVPATVNLTVIVLELNDGFESPSQDAEVLVYIADPLGRQGTSRIASATTGPDGAARIVVPHNQTIIVSAVKGIPDGKLTYHESASSTRYVIAFICNSLISKLI